MSGYATLLSLCGLGLGVGMVLLAVGANAGSRPSEAPAGHRERREQAGRWLALAVAAGLLAGAFTGWIAGGLLAALAVWSIPQFLGRRDGDDEPVERIEGVAGWTEMLRDTLAAAAGLEQAVLATAHIAPQAVAPQILDLAARVEKGERLPVALHQLADDLADPIADLVIAALVLASENQAGKASSLLGELATTARDQVAMRRRVEVGRARMRTTQRVVVGTTLTFAGGLVLLNPAFLAPYSTAKGQVVLLGVGALFATALAWLQRMARIEQPRRFFTAPDAPSGSEAAPRTGR